MNFQNCFVASLFSMARLFNLEIIHLSDVFLNCFLPAKESLLQDSQARRENTFKNESCSNLKMRYFFAVDH